MTGFYRRDRTPAMFHFAGEKYPAQKQVGLCREFLFNGVILSPPRNKLNRT
jgi:hypothetical protein